MNRLCTPYQLKEPSKKRYLDYLREQSKETAKLLCRQDSLEQVIVLAEQGYFTEAILREFQDSASAAGRAEMAGYLLNYRMEHYRPKKKRFDFDEFGF